MLNVKKILVPTDFSKSSDAALKKAGEIAEAFNSELILLHVIPEQSNVLYSYLGSKASKELKEKLKKETEEMFKKQVEDVLGDKKIKIDTIIKFGEPYHEILKLEEDLDVNLVVIASHTKSFFEDVFFGSTTEKVVRRSKKSVLVVRELQ
jgi:nucleotide-binding universal stress UspA family protein